MVEKEIFLKFKGQFKPVKISSSNQKYFKTNIVRDTLRKKALRNNTIKISAEELETIIILELLVAFLNK